MVLPSLLNDIYSSREVFTLKGEKLELNSEVSREEGDFLRSIIETDQTILRTLEVGCAYGVSSLHICSALMGRDASSHTIIDAFQKTWWKSIGITNLERADFKNFELIEEKSEIALPKMLSDGEGKFDFIFIDGWHTFDHAMLDCFYATRLLRIGGYLVLDDANWRSISKLVRYLKSYPCYSIHAAVFDRTASVNWKARLVRRVFSTWPFKHALFLMNSSVQNVCSERISMVALRKISDDTRSFDWFADF